MKGLELRDVTTAAGRALTQILLVGVAKKTETAKNPRRRNGAHRAQPVLPDPLPQLLPAHKDETVGFAVQN